MANLKKYTLEKNNKTDKWDLKTDKSHKTVKSFNTKTVATKKDALKKVLGVEGGSVKIKKQDGKFQEERTYPKSRDPRRTKG